MRPPGGIPAPRAFASRGLPPGCPETSPRFPRGAAEAPRDGSRAAGAPAPPETGGSRRGAANPPHLPCHNRRHLPQTLAKTPTLARAGPPSPRLRAPATRLRGGRETRAGRGRGAARTAHSARPGFSPQTQQPRRGNRAALARVGGANLARAGCARSLRGGGSEGFPLPARASVPGGGGGTNAGGWEKPSWARRGVGGRGDRSARGPAGSASQGNSPPSPPHPTTPAGSACGAARLVLSVGPAHEGPGGTRPRPPSAPLMGSAALWGPGAGLRRRGFLCPARLAPAGSPACCGPGQQGHGASVGAGESGVGLGAGRVCSPGVKLMFSQEFKPELLCKFCQ